MGRRFVESVRGPGGRQPRPTSSHKSATSAASDGTRSVTQARTTRIAPRATEANTASRATHAIVDARFDELVQSEATRRTTLILVQDRDSLWSGHDRRATTSSR